MWKCQKKHLTEYVQNLDPHESQPQTYKVHPNHRNIYIYIYTNRNTNEHTTTLLPPPTPGKKTQSAHPHTQHTDSHTNKQSHEKKNGYPNPIPTTHYHK